MCPSGCRHPTPASPLKPTRRRFTRLFCVQVKKKKKLVVVLTSPLIRVSVESVFMGHHCLSVGFFLLMLCIFGCPNLTINAGVPSAYRSPKFAHDVHKPLKFLYFILIATLGANTFATLGANTMYCCRNRHQRLYFPPKIDPRPSVRLDIPN